MSFVAGDANTFYTTGSTRGLNYKGLWTLLRDRDYVVLRVKSCGEANVRLAYSIVSATFIASFCVRVRLVSFVFLLLHAFRGYLITHLIYMCVHSK